MCHPAAWRLRGAALLLALPLGAHSAPNPASQAVVIDSQTGVSGGPSAVVYQTKPHPSANNGAARPAVPARPAQPRDNSPADDPAPIAPVIVVQPPTPR